MQREVLIVGVHHRKAPVEIRERLSFADGRLQDGLRALLTLAPVDEGVIISTCNRVEVVTATIDGDNAVDALTDFLASGDRIARARLAEHLSVYRGRDAIRHLFRIAASLDSMVIGEPQILGQLKDSYSHAASEGTAGTVLHRCFHKSFSVAKRVRSETGIADKAVSVSSAAVELAAKIFERLDDKTALLLGAGAMSELAARHLLAHGVSRLMVANRTFERAVELAHEFQGTPVPFEEFPRYLSMADMVIGSTAADDYVLTRDRMREVLHARRYRPIFLIDMSVPRNFDPAINELDNAYLYDIDDLGEVAQINREERGREADKAEAIVDAEVDSFWKWLATLEAVPTIVALREKMDTIRKGELEKTLATLRPLAPREREALEAMTAAIVNKILHGPITHLKQHHREHEAFYVAAARQLFDLQDPDSQ
ncbi:MAG: glutamyl-tRNA reductase [Candidatus Binatia bacterium]